MDGIGKLASLKAYGDTEGPLGFPMPSALAKLAEKAIKDMPKELRDEFSTVIDGQKVEGFCRSYAQPKGMDFNDAEQSDVSIITSEALDHDDEVVMAGGLDFSTFFQKNMVVPLCHNYKALPVGRGLWVAKTKTDSGSAYKAKTRYTPRPETHPKELEWFPSTVYQFVKCGDLCGKSIGYIPTSFHRPTRDEIGKNPTWKDATRIVDGGMVLEYSVCPIGVNPEALVESVGKMRAKGMMVGKEFFDAMGVVIPEQPTSVQEVETRETIVLKGKIEDISDMPTCPKCQTNASMVKKAESYTCQKCETNYKIDVNGSMSELPVAKAVVRFVRPETIRKAVEEKLATAMKAADGHIDSCVTDKLNKLMGRV